MLSILIYYSILPRFHITDTTQGNLSAKLTVLTNALKTNLYIFTFGFDIVIVLL